MNENPYAAPKSPVLSSEDENPKPSAGTRFLLTTACAAPVYMAFTLFGPREAWLMGALGSVILGVFSGLIALCIPVRTKILFILPSVLAGLVIAFLIGNAD